MTERELWEQREAHQKKIIKQHEEEVAKLQPACTMCGAKATRSHREDPTGRPFMYQHSESFFYSMEGWGYFMYPLLKWLEAQVSYEWPPKWACPKCSKRIAEFMANL